MAVNNGWSSDWFDQMIGMPDGSMLPAGSMTYGGGGQALSATNNPFGTGPTGSLFGGQGGSFGFNLPTAGLVLGGLQAVGGLWQGMNANRLARDSFNFSKKMAEKNLANQTQSYNTALEDRARSRGAMEGQSTAQTQAYIDRNRL